MIQPQCKGTKFALVLVKSWQTEEGQQINWWTA